MACGLQLEELAHLEVAVKAFPQLSRGYIERMMLALGHAPQRERKERPLQEAP